MKYYFSMTTSLMVTIFTLAQDVRANDWAFHRELLKNKFDTAYWKKFWEDGLWHIRAIFVDMDGDGLEEMIAITTSEEDRMGDYWKIWKYDGVGKFKQVFFSGNIFFSCHSDSFYKVSYSDKPDAVVGLGMNANVEKDCGNGDRRIVRPTPDCKFVLAQGNKFMLCEIRPDVDTSFRRNGVARIERLYPEWYFGYDFKPPADVPHSVYTQRMPYKLPQGDLRRVGGIGCPKDFAAFVAKYRHEVKMRTCKKGKVTVYAVFLDADNDGDGDCYMSSDAEATVNGEYIWSLYICNNGQYSMATEAVFPVGTRKELSKLPNTVNAGRMSFCRVIRYDAAPTFVILNKENRADSIVRETITNYQAHSIEKLPCGEYKEER